MLTAAGALLLGYCAGNAALPKKQGGILRVPHFDSPASMSLLEESTVAVNPPMMGVFNNLVMFKQDVPQNSLKSIVPDLATGWTMPDPSFSFRAARDVGGRSLRG